MLALSFEADKYGSEIIIIVDKTFYFFRTMYGLLYETQCNAMYIPILICPSIFIQIILASLYGTIWTNGIFNKEFKKSTIKKI